MAHAEESAEDRRVRRTKKLIQEAFIALTAQKGFAAVTVRDITEQADVNRATFYRHYQDKFDLLDQYAEEVYQLLEASDAAHAQTQAAAAKAPPAGLIQLFEHVRAQAAFYRVMLSKQGNPGFSAKIERFIQDRIGQALSEAQRAQPQAQMFLRYVASGSVGLLLWWLEHDCPLAPTEMAALSMRISAADLGAIVGHAALDAARRSGQLGGENV